MHRMGPMSTGLCTAWDSQPPSFCQLLKRATMRFGGGPRSGRPAVILRWWTSFVRGSLSSRASSGGTTPGLHGFRMFVAPCHRQRTGWKLWKGWWVDLNKILSYCPTVIQPYFAGATLYPCRSIIWWACAHSLWPFRCLVTNVIVLTVVPRGSAYLRPPHASVDLEPNHSGKRSRRGGVVLRSARWWLLFRFDFTDASISSKLSVSACTSGRGHHLCRVFFHIVWCALGREGGAALIYVGHHVVKLGVHQACKSTKPMDPSSLSHTTMGRA